MHEKTLQTRRLNPTQNHLNSVFHFEEASITLCFFLYESHTPLHLPTSLSVSRSLRIPFEHTEFVCILLEFGLEDNEGAVSCDESEPPLKRSHRGQQENQVSSRMERSSTMWLPEKGEIAPKNFRQERMDSSRSSLKDRRRVTSSDSCREQFDDKKKCTTSSEIAAKDVKSTSERASSTVHFKQPMGGSNGALIIGTSKKGLNKMELRSSSDSFGLDVDSSQALTFCKRRSIHDINDITKGEFAYTPRGLLKRNFLDTYISMSKEPQKHHYFYCEDCPLERSKNQYLPDPCKGHLVRKFIKECWRKCGCSMYCGNRIVQRGITFKLQVFMTHEGKGWGLRTLEALPKGAFVCEYVGEILTNMELYERNKQSNGNDRHTYPVLLDADWGSEGVLKDEEALCLDATFYGNVARFINHRCFDANLLEIPVEIESPDHHYYHLAFFTKRKVDALEELTWDYAIDFADENHPIKAFQCCCGSEFCRDMNGKGIKASDS